MRHFENFSKVKVLVVGDVMLDRYWSGSVERISPEAPVPIVNHRETKLVLGGAANVAANVAGLDAEPFLVGAVGSDDESRLLSDILETSSISSKHLLVCGDRPTTTKTRIMAHNQQVLRLDRESDDPLSESRQKSLWSRIDKILDKVDIVVASDYGKGVLTDGLLGRLIARCRTTGKKILIDPKGKNYLKYSGATLLTPNVREAAEACHSNEKDLTVSRAGEILLAKIKLDGLLVTQGEFGMTLFRGSDAGRHFPARAREIYDVTGAGDTVISTLAVGLAAGADWLNAVEWANAAAGLVVEQLGTTAVKLRQLRQLTETAAL